MNLFFRLVEQILKSLWRASVALGRSSLHHGWTRPKQARGWKWALTMWAFLVPTLWLTSILFSTHRPEVLPLMVTQGVALFAMDKLWHSPKRLGRPLDWRRHR